MGAHVGIYQPKTNWYQVVQYHAARSGNVAFGEAVSLRLEFRMPRTTSLPKTREKPHTTKPDCDNLAKGVMDAICPALIERDQLVTELQVSKRYALPGETPGCRITITEAV